jgi:hypothetical protein
MSGSFHPTKHITVHDRTGQRTIPLQPEPAPLAVARATCTVPPTIVDPYAPHSHQVAQLVTQYEANPESRAKAMVTKTTAVTLFLGLLTWAALGMLGEFTFLLWLFCASGEWVLCFIVLAVLDWRETPAAIAWRQSEGYLDLMRREQAARLQAMYGIDPREADG